MLFPLTGIVIGALIGVWRARKRAGTPADLVQWAMVHAIVFGLIGLFALIVVDRVLY